jgi:Cys-tRNA(Pro)/Cys-tRNA(Cys) deacylase
MYDEILTLLTTRGIPFKIHEHVSSRTVTDARERLSFPLDRLLKTIAFKRKAGGWILAAVRAPDRVDYKSLAQAVGAKRADLLQLSPQEVHDVFGVEVGSVGPIVLRGDVQVLLDSNITRNETVYCGVGRDDRTLEIRLSDLVQITGGRVLPLCKDEG